MNLDLYLRTTGTRPTDFAADIGTTVQALHRYRTGQRLPKREVMQEITRATNGAVTANDFFAPASPAPADPASAAA